MKNCIFVILLAISFLFYGKRRAHANPVEFALKSTNLSNDQSIPFEQTDFANAMVLGKPDAPITVIEFTSISCIHCAHYYTSVYPALKKDYIDTGIVRILTVHFPYDSFAYLAQILLEEIPLYERHSAMLKLLHTQSDWLPKDQRNSEIKKAHDNIMKILGFTEKQLKEFSKNIQKIDKNIEHIYKITQKYNVTATPTFFVNGIPFTQDVTFDNFKHMFDIIRQKTK